METEKEGKKKGREVRMTEGPLWNKILAYALPLAATGILQQFFNAADVAVVGRFTGEQGPTAMAAVGANSPVIGLAINTLIGVSLGTNVVIANAIGSGDKITVKKAVQTSICMALIVGIIMVISGQLLASAVLHAQNIPDEVFPYAVKYFRIYFWGSPVILLYNFEAAIFRGVGNTKTPLIALVFSGALNIVLNLFFVLGLHMTVEGVAIATVVSNLTSASILFYDLLKADSVAKISIRELSIDFRVLAKILRIGIPAGLQSGVFNLANMIIQSAINSLGTIVMAASSAAFNIEVFVWNVINAFGQACTTFTGQNFGAGKIRRCKKAALLCWGEGLLFMGSAIFFVLLAGHQMLSIFNTDPEVIRVGYIRLVLIFSAYIFSLTYDTMSGYLRGFGISVVPAVLTMVGVCGVRITWIYGVFPHYRTFANIMLVYPISLAVTAALIFCALCYFKPSKKWGNDTPAGSE
ncbi:MAG: MATE family efflux transporter [Lachnospiraceae bacterium]|nr:MATE family efflux transporter [Lachnospiraceae bacterium]